MGKAKLDGPLDIREKLIFSLHILGHRERQPGEMDEHILQSAQVIQGKESTRYAKFCLIRGKKEREIWKRERVY
jgi:hypothetical protein